MEYGFVMSYHIQVSVRNSTISGRGLFADEFIPAGKLIWEITPHNAEIVTIEKLKWYEQNATSTDFDELLNHTFMEPTLKQMYRILDNERFKNHAEIANTITRNTRVFALTEILPDTELTENYGTFDPFPEEVQILLNKRGIWTYFGR